MLNPPIATNLFSIAYISLAMSLLGCQKSAPDDKQTVAVDSQDHDNVEDHANEHANDHANKHESDHDNEHHLEDKDHEHKEHENHGHKEHDHEEHENQGHEGEGHEEHGHEGHNHAMNRTTYSCQPDKEIKVFYHSDSTPPTAHLLIDGIEYDLSTERTNIEVEHIDDTTDDTYVSKIGLDDSHGLIWQTRADTATLSTFAVKNSTSGDNKTVIFDCRKG